MKIVTKYEEIKSLERRLKSLKRDRNSLIDRLKEKHLYKDTDESISEKLFQYLKGYSPNWAIDFAHSTSFSNDDDRNAYFFYYSLNNSYDENEATLLTPLSDAKHSLKHILDRDIWVREVNTNCYKGSLKEFIKETLRLSPTKFIRKLQDLDVPVEIIYEPKIDSRKWVICLPPRKYKYKRSFLQDYED